MDRTRIRWRNVGRLAAALGGAAALVGVLPGLLTPPEPEPLPSDVGLVAGTTGAHAYAPPKPSRTARRGPAGGGRNHRRRGAAPERPRPDRSPSPLPAETPGNGSPQASRLTGAPAPPEPPPASPPAPGPTPAPEPAPAPAPEPAPVPAPPRPPQPSPPAPVEPDQPDEPASPPSAGHPDQQQGPSQFGFEY
jgi:hypothetical protein